MIHNKREPLSSNKHSLKAIYTPKTSENNHEELKTDGWLVEAVDFVGFASLHTRRKPKTHHPTH